MTIFAQSYIDEDVDILVATLLIARGLEATTARQQKTLGELDPQQLAFAAPMGCCTLTHNRLNFEKLHTSYGLNSQTHSEIPMKLPKELPCFLIP